MTLTSEPQSSAGPNAPRFWGIVGVWVAVDIVTKALAVARLHPPFGTEVIGEYLRFSLVFNKGAAFGMHLGEWSRWVFTALTIGALVMLWHLYRETKRGDTVRVIALALVTAGALGNLVDRLRWTRGVVDFIDVGVGTVRFWTFNVADVGVSCGAVLLAIVLWREERALHAAAASAPLGATDPGRTAAEAPQS